MGGKKLCDASDVVEPGFGEQYALLKRSSTTLDKGFKGVVLQYKIPHITNPVSTLVTLCPIVKACPDASYRHHIAVSLKKLSTA